MPMTPSNESTTPGITYKQLADDLVAAGPGTTIKVTMPQLLALWTEVMDMGGQAVTFKLELDALKERVKALEGGA